MGNDHVRRAVMVSVVLASFLAGPVLLPYASGETRSIEISSYVPFLDFNSYQIYGMKGGELKIRFLSNISVHLFVFEEGQRESIQDAMHPDGKDSSLVKKTSVTAVNFSLKTRSDTNYYIIVQNYGCYYNRSAVFRLHVDSTYEDKKGIDLNWNYLYLLLVPLILIPVVIWIRKRA